MLKNFFGFVFELIKIVVISLVIIIPVRYFLIQPFYVKGASMEPNFYDHEYLIIDEITYRFEEPKRGDIIVFRYPKNPQEFFIKRIIGLPNEEVTVKEDRVWVTNAEYPEGAPLEETYLADGMKSYSMNQDTVKLGPEEFFVMGDNRTSSKDSRSFGPVPRGFITGRVVFRGWPPSRIDVFKASDYPDPFTVEPGI